MKKYDLLIIGNGFDLNFKYKTSYEDFCNYLEKFLWDNKLALFFDLAKDQGYLNKPYWNSFEKMLCQYLCFIEYIFSDNNNVYFEYEIVEGAFKNFFRAKIIIKDISKMPISFYHILDICNPLEGKLDYYLKLGNDEKIHMNQPIRYYPNRWNSASLEMVPRKCYLLAPTQLETKIDLIDLVNELLKDLESKLAKYIKEATNVDLPASSFVENELNKDVKCILSFNYSHVAERYFRLQKDSIAYVHGDVDGDIVLGIENNMMDEQIISEQSCFSEFFKRARRIIKKCNENFSEKILSNIFLDSEIAIFGHSLDAADSSIFKKIFAMDFNHCDIYYFGEEETYRKRFILLIGLDLFEELYNDSKISFIKIP